MRFIIADTYYDEFLADFYQARPEAAALPYDEHCAELMSERFCTGDAYAAGLRACGCDATTLVINSKPLQECWAREAGFTAATSGGNWKPEIFIEQVRRMRPDVVYLQELSAADDHVIAQLKPHTRLVVGQIACTLPRRRAFRAHDLIVSSLPPIVDYFRAQGKASERLALGFDRSVIDAVDVSGARHGVSFVGGLSGVHRERIALLEYLCERTPMHVYGYGLDQLAEDSPVRDVHRGTAWGMKMYAVLAGSQIVLNCHGEVEVGAMHTTHWANNCRLFEATGVGACLLTDQKQNLAEFFAPHEEVAVYSSPEECLERISELRADPARRRQVAEAGQRRTLSEHTYQQRMTELFAMIEAYL